MKFKFGLQKVMEHRRIKEDLAKKNFLQAANELALEEKRLNDMNHELRLAREESYTWQNVGGPEGGRLQFIEEYIVGQKERIRRQEKEVERFQQRLEEKRVLLVQAGREFKVLEKLKEKKYLDFRKEMKKKEIKILDDVNLMHGNRRQKI